MDRATLYIEFAHFYCEVKPYIQGISSLCNTYGSFKRIPLSKFEPYHTKLFSLYQKNKKLFKEISSSYNYSKINSEDKEYIKNMLIFINSLSVLLIYFDYYIEL